MGKQKITIGEKSKQNATSPRDGHSPGPWYLENEGSEVIGPDGDWVVEDLVARNPADRTLIAAAPDLLEALRTLLDMYVRMAVSGDCGNWDQEQEPEVIMARAALAKAEGKSI